MIMMGEGGGEASNRDINIERGQTGMLLPLPGRDLTFGLKAEVSRQFLYFQSENRDLRYFLHFIKKKTEKGKNGKWRLSIHTPHNQRAA